jgi:hypothetical protein
LNARADGWSTTEDYLRFLEQSDPDGYEQLVEDFNANAGIWDTYGDLYQFQASYDRLQATEGGEPPDPSELTNAATALLQAFVDADLIDGIVAADMVGDPDALVNWYSNILQYEGVGDLTPPPSSSIEPDELFYYNDDANQERPYVRDDSGNFVPYLAEGESLDQGRVIRIEGDTITVVRDQYDYSDGGTSSTSGTSGTSSTSGTSGDPDIEYASWDTNEEHPFIYDESSESFVPALRDGERRVITSEGAEIVDESGDVIREEHSDWREAPSTGIRGIEDDGITAEDVPVTSDGIYNLSQDVARSPEDIASSYLGPDATLDLAQEFQTGWDRSNPVDNQAIFTSEVDLFPGLNLPTVERQVGTIPRQRGGMVGLDQPIMQTFYISDLRNVNSINYEPSNLVEISPTSLISKDAEWQSEQLASFFPERTGRDSRPSRILNEVMNPWEFSIFEDKEIQQLMFTELKNYSDITGVPLNTVFLNELSDIGTYDEDSPSNVFDAEHFMVGSEESGWDGFSSIIRDFASDNGLGEVGSESDMSSQENLKKFAWFSKVLLKPMMDRIEEISDIRSTGQQFDQNISIPSAYSNSYGTYNLPDYLSGGGGSLYLPGPPDEGAGVIPGTGGFAGGIVNAMAGGGYIGGADGGMDDTIPASIDGSNAAALSSGEFVVPADVVSHLGDGNNQNGASKLYQLLDQVRTVKTGSTEQPAPFNDGMMSGILGDNYGR